MARRKLTGLRPQTYEHPLDAQALNALQKTSGLDTVVRKCNEWGFERLLRVDREDEYALRHLWRLYVHRGFTAQALDAARRLQALFPRDAALKAEVARLEKLVR